MRFQAKIIQSEITLAKWVKKLSRWNLNRSKCRLFIDFAIETLRERTFGTRRKGRRETTWKSTLNLSLIHSLLMKQRLKLKLSTVNSAVKIPSKDFLWPVRGAQFEIWRKVSSQLQSKELLSDALCRWFAVTVSTAKKLSTSVFCVGSAVWACARNANNAVPASQPRHKKQPFSGLQNGFLAMCSQFMFGVYTFCTKFRAEWEGF